MTDRLYYNGIVATHRHLPKTKLLFPVWRQGVLCKL
nr:MAG TPA: hypothetical protein [Caudoviricetes sp.]